MVPSTKPRFNTTYEGLKQMETNNPKSLRVLRAPAVHDKTGLTKNTIQRLEQSGEFPRRIKLGAHAAGWLEHEIDAWIAKRVALSRSL
jgi:prophage regulatory protein